jgi:hypothetical protein
MSLDSPLLSDAGERLQTIRVAARVLLKAVAEMRLRPPNIRGKWWEVKGQGKN